MEPASFRFLLRRWGLLIALVAGLGYQGSLAYETVDLQLLTEETIRPGDLVVLELTVMTDAYVRYELKEPSHPGLSLVSIQAFPVTLRGDADYFRKWTLVYQAMRSGEMSLEGGALERGEENEVVSVAIEPLSFKVEGFGAATDSDEVELPLESEAPFARRPSTWVWMILILVGVVAIIGLKLRLKGHQAVEPRVDEGERAAAYLRSEMASGRIPRWELERFLVRFRDRCSGDLVQAMEREVYSELGNVKEIEQLLGREFGT